MMRSYLDNHHVLRQMQDLLADMVQHRPDDPIEYMIQRLEEVCRDGVCVGPVDGEAPTAAVDAPAADAPAKVSPLAAKHTADDEQDANYTGDEEEGSEDGDCIQEL